MTEDDANTAAADWLKPLQDFLRLEAAGGVLLMVAAVLALLVANSPLAAAYDALLDLPVRVGFGSLLLAKPLLLWINDGLMAVFFFLVGLELKRELLEGHLSCLRRARLPAIAAVGRHAGAGADLRRAQPRRRRRAARLGDSRPRPTSRSRSACWRCWASRVPTALKAFLLSVAIFDDLGAIIVIAVFYTATLSMLSLVVAAAADRRAGRAQSLRRDDGLRPTCWSASCCGWRC